MATAAPVSKRRGDNVDVKKTKVKRRQGAAKKPVVRLSRLQKPAEMSLEAWQTELRRQFGREQPFTLKNVGRDLVFSDFLVINPQSDSTYDVRIRGTEPGDNYCSCPDF